MVYQYFKSEDIDLLEIIQPMREKQPFGFAAPISLRKNPEKKVGFIMFVKDSADIGTVSHESVHVCNMMFEYVGQMADEWNDEIQAYIVGHLTKVFMEEIRGEKRQCRELIKGAYTKNIGK